MMMMSRVVLKHQWIMLIVMSQWRMSGSISHTKYSGMSSIVDQWQDAGGVSGMLKMFMGEGLERVWLCVWNPTGFFC